MYEIILNTLDKIVSTFFDILCGVFKAQLDADDFVSQNYFVFNFKVFKYCLFGKKIIKIFSQSLKKD